MVQRRLRLPLFSSEFQCGFCNDNIDIYGDHCLVCSCGGGRTCRHNFLCNEVYFCCVGASLERPGFLQPRPLIGSRSEDGGRPDDSGLRRPADVYVPRWRNGIPAAFDFAVTSGLRQTVIASSAQDGSAAACRYEDYKREYLDTAQTCADEGLTFIPVVAEAHGGGWSPNAHKLLSELAKRKASLTGELDSKVACELHQKLGLILHRENARAILRRWPGIASAAST